MKLTIQQKDLLLGAVMREVDRVKDIMTYSRNSSITVQNALYDLNLIERELKKYPEVEFKS